MVFDRLKKVFKVVAPEYDISTITPGSKLMGDLGITSITMLLLVIACEEEFGIKFSNIKSTDFITVNDVCKYIEVKLH